MNPRRLEPDRPPNDRMDHARPSRTQFLFFLVASGSIFGFPAASAAPESPPTSETRCSDRIDEDRDTVTDCADADCYDAPECKTAGGLENSDATCTDFIDNDGDGAVDCDDADCNGPAVRACLGSWEGPLEGTGVRQTPNASPDSAIPKLEEGQSVEDLIGTGDDVDGERNNFVCADGVDNDNDGRTDCDDFGCRFDQNVTVCRPTPGLRFSVAAHAQVSHDFEAEDRDGDGETETPWDTRVNRLQLRAFGPIPFIQDSFFLISIRAEAAPRLTFAFFTVPLGGGHFVNVNSGGGGLSNALVLSVSKNILLDPAFYVYNAFEQGNGAAVEFSGPLSPDRKLAYRAFVAGGSGEFNGNIGGRFFNQEERNFTWGAGAQLAYFIVGRFDRWDTRYLYTPVPLSWTFYLGGRYDNREFERFGAANAHMLFRFGRFLLSAEGYGKREINFGSWQISWNAQLGLLLISKRLLLAADVGSFFASEFDDLGDLNGNNLPDELRRLRDELQWRVALHTYLWRNTGLLSLLYTDRRVEKTVGAEEDDLTRELRLEAQFRF